MASTKHRYFPVRVHLPRNWVECPLCGLHYIIKGRPSQRLCDMVDRTWSMFSTKEQ